MKNNPEFPGNCLGGSGQCKYCLRFVNNVAQPESDCCFNYSQNGKKETSTTNKTCRNCGLDIFTDQLSGLCYICWELDNARKRVINSSKNIEKHRKILNTCTLVIDICLVIGVLCFSYLIFN
jgi:hypothetical protein